MAHHALQHKRVDRESHEQRLCFEYMRVVHREAFSHAYHVPNGGHRHKATAAKLKAEGVKAGVPDIKVALARGGFFGLYVEMKAKAPHSSAVSPKQKEWLARLAGAGYCTRICKGYGEFKAVIDEYMSWPETQPTQCPAAND
ncbi:VRR-NUC domain-containing protein [Sansalvadorimonas verongulae]|uniref:VRR-NUC domain-containing protein n=1 Tax=Sansalvadorimonas verongulae TaxID=2172824 RepID=UPI0012BB5A66|nr:VRR-NUC domain-containing protein [Sansalvadorimonas verongulae]MTI12368.1 VRR-NUC domain-containing protein [Sansalvadorimonas verongulae]